MPPRTSRALELALEFDLDLEMEDDFEAVRDEIGDTRGVCELARVCERVAGISGDDKGLGG